MKPVGVQGVVVVVAAVASLAITGLITLQVFRGGFGGPQVNPPPGARPGVLPGAGEQPPALIELPAFELTERSGRTVALADLRGKVCVFDFIFTRCPGACPAMTSRLAELQLKLRDRPDWDDIRLVSVSVDPGYDTPAVLQSYARLAHADDTHWLMLTGSRSAVWSLVKDGFKLPVSDNPGNTATPIVHSQKFVLVDRAGWVRGYYDALERTGPDGVATADELADLVRDLERVSAEPRQ